MRYKNLAKKVAVITLSVCMMFTMVPFFGLGIVDSANANEGEWTPMTEWSTVQPESKNNRRIEKKVQYRYRNQEIKYSGKDSISGYTKSSTETLSTSYGDWSPSSEGRCKASDNKGDQKRTTVTVETKTAYKSYAWYCKCEKWSWKTKKGKCKYCGKATDCKRFNIYTTKSLSGSGYKKDTANDGSYVLPKTISISSPGKMGTMYCMRYGGADGIIKTFTSKMVTGVIYLWPDDTKPVSRTKKVVTRNKFWRWGNWTGWSDSSVAATATRQVETRTLYRYSDYIEKPNPVEKYTITFNANGGTGAPASQTKEKGKTLYLSTAIPTRTGYEFIGWATSGNSTTAAYKAGGEFTANADTTLYAVWKKTDSSKKSILNCNISIIGSNRFVYNCNYKSVSFNIMDGEKQLEIGKDYTVSNNRAINAGTYYATITGIGNYNESLRYPFYIDKNNLTFSFYNKSGSITEGSSNIRVVGYRYSNNAKVSFKSSNNNIATINSEGMVTAKKAGKVTITGTASAGSNYNNKSDSYTLTVNSLSKPGNVKSSSFKISLNYGKATLKWNAAANASYYQIYYKIAGADKWSEATSSGCSKTFNGLAPGKKYKYKVRAIRKNGNITKASDFTDKKAVKTKENYNIVRYFNKYKYTNWYFANGVGSPNYIYVPKGAKFKFSNPNLEVVFPDGEKSKVAWYALRSSDGKYYAYQKKKWVSYGEAIKMNSSGNFTGFHENTWIKLSDQILKGHKNSWFELIPSQI